VLVAPDSFKGTFSAVQVAEAIGRGLTAEGIRVDLCPVADGGEGTLDALAAAFACELRKVAARDPLGRPVQTTYGLGRLARGQTVAVLETAAASGLGLVAAAERDAVSASTYGTGELIATAVAEGAAVIYLGVGGSATTDGGAGAIEAIERGGGLREAKLVVLCDVRTRFTDAARVFAPQKGASPAQVRSLARRLDRLAQRLPRDPREVPMTGAAGGLSGGLWAACGAQLVPGAAFVLDALGYDARMRAARAVVTGEGKLDEQSLAGKLISEIATRARQAGVPCHAIVGTRELDAFGARVLDLGTILEATTLAELESAGRRLADVVGLPEAERHASPSGGNG
jgi:glycerate 2-kinase